MHYLVLALAISNLLLGWLYVNERSELAVQTAVNEKNRQAIALIEKQARLTEEVLVGWDTDRTTLAQIRVTIRKELKGAMYDETFKAWAAVDAPAGAWGLLRQAADPGAADNHPAPGNPDASLPGN
jgi:hypothetical protein